MNSNQLSLLLVLVCFLAGHVLAQAVTPQNCKGQPNELPITTTAPTAWREVPNGRAFLAGNVEPQIKVIHMWGTAYDQGRAQGELLKDILPEYMDEVLNYIYEQIDEVIKPYLPLKWRQMIEVNGTAAALDLTYDLTKPYIPQYFIDECHGIADGSGVDFETILRLSLLPELIQAHCSMVGAWGAAIANTDGTLYQLRALDWDTNGPFQKQPVLLVYHNEAGSGNTYSVVGYAGMVGAFTGFSDAPMGICEKVWLSYEGHQSRVGIPWTYLLRDILQWDHTNEDAVNRIHSAKRTCSIFIGLGDATPDFNVVQYSNEVVNVFNNTYQPTWAAHPQYQDALYVDKHKQPSNDPCLGSLIGTYYGDLDATTIMRKVAPVHETGDTHIAVYDYAANMMYVSNCGVVPEGGDDGEPAYNRPFTGFNMTELFALQPPTTTTL